MTINTKILSRQIIITIEILLILLIIAFAIVSVWFTPFQAFRIVFGTFLTIFLPGLVLSFIFFPATASIARFEDGDQEGGDHAPALDWIERISLSFVLSFCVVPLIIYLSNRLSLPITAASTLYLTGGLVIFGIIVLLIKKLDC